MVSEPERHCQDKRGTEAAKRPALIRSRSRLRDSSRLSFPAPSRPRASPCFFALGGARRSVRGEVFLLGGSVALVMCHWPAFYLGRVSSLARPAFLFFPPVRHVNTSVIDETYVVLYEGK